MLHALLVRLDYHLVLLLQVLQLPLLIPQIRLLILQILLLHNPKVIQLLTLLLELVERRVLLPSLLRKVSRLQIRTC